MGACNGCRVLRRKCGGEKCMLRYSLPWAWCPQAQANATHFVAKFFGRVTLFSLLSSVPQDQRPVLFESLVHEAVGRVVNPVSGAVGLLGAGRWGTCQSAVDTLLLIGSSSLISCGPGAEARFFGGKRLKRGPKSGAGDDSSSVKRKKREGTSMSLDDAGPRNRSKALKLFF